MAKRTEEETSVATDWLINFNAISKLYVGGPGNVNRNTPPTETKLKPKTATFAVVFWPQVKAGSERAQKIRARPQIDCIRTLKTRQCTVFNSGEGNSRQNRRETFSKSHKYIERIRDRMKSRKSHYVDLAPNVVEQA